MPELPDLTIFSRNIQKTLGDKTVSTVDVMRPAKITAPVLALREKLTGARLTAADREGKEVHLRFSSGAVLGVHLMLHGGFFLCAAQEAAAIPGAMLSLGFTDSPSLVIADRQGLCKITLNPRPAKAPDALSPTFTYDYFSRASRKKAGETIKGFLIDQNIVRGIGNAYADEILYTANIAPDSIAAKIPDEALRTLYRAIPAVLTDAIASIERVAPDITSGEERSFLRVHNRHKKVTDEGDPILTKTVATKNTYYTAKQKLYL